MGIDINRYTSFFWSFNIFCDQCLFNLLY